jgi:tRNA dimethylallyltransferase
MSVRPIVILGPTAGGKSELAVRIAEALTTFGGGGAEIISADSMQIYRHMDAGTAKPSPAQRARAPHHMVDVVEPTERFTVADWLDQTEELISELQSRNATPIVVGGTNLYIKALLEGLFDGPPHDEAFRAEVADVAPQVLHDQLKEVDPPTAERLHPNDHKKIVRALEVFRTTGKPISESQTQWKERHEDTEAQGHEVKYRFNPILIGMGWPVDLINQRINLRVKAMFFPDKVDPAIAAEVTPSGESIIDETRRLEDAGLLGKQAREALGYKQVLAHFAGEISLDDAFERTKILTRRFAKTQRTWLKRFRGVHWIESGESDADQIATSAFSVVISDQTPPFDPD